MNAAVAAPGFEAGDDAVTNVVSSTIRAPIDRVRLLLQTQGELLKQGRLNTRYGNPLDCARRTMHTDGWASLWRGNAVGMLQQMITSGVTFSARSETFRINTTLQDGYVIFFGSHFFYGGVTGAWAAAVTHPIRYVGTKLACDAKVDGKYQYASIWDIVKKTFASDGIPGFYRGILTMTSYHFVYRAVYFGFYDAIRPLLPQHFAVRFAVGYAVTIMAGLAAYPLETIGRRMMMTSATSKGRYRHSADAIMQICRTGGVQALWCGAGVNVVSSIIGALLLAVMP